MCDQTVCIPGERLCSSEQYQAGRGTYVRHGSVFATLSGRVEREKESGDNLPLIHVQSVHSQQLVPEIGAIVICKITQLSSSYAKCKILSVRGSYLNTSFRGMIRKEDVRSTNRDKVEIYKSFRPGDVVVAKVLSLGDASCYLLSTAENELGVVIALSENGDAMIPLSHDQMQCPKSLIKENRKVARPQSDYLSFPEGLKTVLMKNDKTSEN